MGNFRSTKQITNTPLPPPLDDRVWQVVVSELGLAPQQDRIVQLLMQSKSDKEVADELGLSFHTVRSYLKRIFARTATTDRMQLVHRVYAIAIRVWTQRVGTFDAAARNGVTMNGAPQHRSGRAPAT